MGTSGLQVPYPHRVTEYNDSPPSTSTILPHQRTAPTALREFFIISFSSSHNLVRPRERGGRRGERGRGIVCLCIFIYTN